MVNHPNRSRTYWIIYPRDFANEFTVAVATNKDSADNYAAEGYVRLTRARALSRLTYRGDAATQAYVGAEYDHFPADRFALAAAVREGRPVEPQHLYA